MFMTRSDSKDFLWRSDTSVHEKVKREAQLRGIPMNAMLNRVLSWWADQDEATKDDSIKYSADRVIADKPKSRLTPGLGPGVIFERGGKITRHKG